MFFNIFTGFCSSRSTGLWSCCCSSSSYQVAEAVEALHKQSEAANISYSSNNSYTFDLFFMFVFLCFLCFPLFFSRSRSSLDSISSHQHYSRHNISIYISRHKHYSRNSTIGTNKGVLAGVKWHEIFFKKFHKWSQHTKYSRVTKNINNTHKFVIEN